MVVVKGPIKWLVAFEAEIRILSEKNGFFPFY